jgi:hypothetical protein
MTVPPSLAPNPFAPPDAEAQAAPARAPPVVAGYRDQAAVVRLLTVLLIGHAALLAADAISSLLLRSSLVDPQVIQAVLRTLHRIRMLPLFMTLAIALPFAIFLARANRNARRFGEEFLVFTPASMVWWYFVPVLNLAMPYRAVREVWRASRPVDGQDPDNGGVLIWWWASLLAYQLVVLAMMFGAPILIRYVAPKSALGVLNSLWALRSGLSVARDLAALMMVGALHERQRQRATSP